MTVRTTSRRGSVLLKVSASLVVAGAVAIATSIVVASATSHSAVTTRTYRTSTIPYPPPGTLSQVKNLVAAAPKITKIPHNVDPALVDSLNDIPTLDTPSLARCQDQFDFKTSCTFGDVHAVKTMVLWGDSHAFMWFPAMDAIAKKYRWKLDVAYLYDCPIADISVWNPLTNEANTGCNTYRADIISKINKLHPALLVMSEQYFTEDSNQSPISTTEWTNALESTLGAISSKIRKVLIGDTIDLSTSNEPPPYCLSAYPTKVQTCSTPEKNATYTSERKSEAVAAAAEGTKYVNVIPWSCSAVCTPIIGNMIVYYAQGHFTSTYDAYLSNVLYLAIKSAM
jgi:hypothetical protein